MENGEASTRATIGFPLGTGLLLVVLLCMTGFISFCYHWDRLRSLLSSNSEDSSTSPSDPPGHIPPLSPPTTTKAKQKGELMVLMPGDEVPKFIARPCYCEPPRFERMMVKVQSPSTCALQLS